MSEALDVWSQGCHLVLDQSGRARVHDTRAALNSIALGIEVLRHETSTVPTPTAARVLDLMQRDVQAAADELTGLHALLTLTGSGTLTRLQPALEWADQVTRPVARRCGVEFQGPAPGTVPMRTVDPGFALATALVLVEAVLTAPRGGRCVWHLSPDADALLVEWQASPEAPADPAPLGRALFGLMPGTDPRLTASGSDRTVRVVLPRAA